MVKTYDPLRCIPSTEVIRERLKATEEAARKLRVLLDTAVRIEAEGDRDPNGGSTLGRARS